MKKSKILKASLLTAALGLSLFTSGGKLSSLSNNNAKEYKLSPLSRKNTTSPLSSPNTAVNSTSPPNKSVT